MDAARCHFESQGYKCEDCSKTCPYDLRCRRDGELLYVEVKGTQTDGLEVILTCGEVRFLRDHKGHMALFVLHSIRVDERPNEFDLSGGVHHLIQPWDVDIGTLTPLSFMYGLPDRQTRGMQ